MDNTTANTLADALDALADEATKPVPLYPGSDEITRPPDPAVVALAKAIKLIADAVRTEANGNQV